MTASGRSATVTDPGSLKMAARIANREAVPARTGAPMDITRSSIDTAKGPEEWFTGDVYIDAVAAAPAPARAQANLVRFTPGARTAWHTHPLGQTIYVTEGVGLCQRRGGPAEGLPPGVRLLFPA